MELTATVTGTHAWYDISFRGQVLTILPKVLIQSLTTMRIMLYIGATGLEHLPADKEMLVFLRP